MNKEKLNELNTKILEMQKQILADKQTHSNAILTYDIALNAKTTELLDEYTIDKDKRLSNETKRSLMANEEPAIKMLLKDCDKLSNDIKLKEIEISFMKREFYILMGGIIVS